MSIRHLIYFAACGYWQPKYQLTFVIIIIFAVASIRPHVDQGDNVSVVSWHNEVGSRSYRQRTHAREHVDDQLFDAARFARGTDARTVQAPGELDGA